MSKINMKMNYLAGLQYWYTETIETDELGCPLELPGKLEKSTDSWNPLEDSLLIWGVAWA